MKVKDIWALVSSEVHMRAARTTYQIKQERDEQDPQDLLPAGGCYWRCC